MSHRSESASALLTAYRRTEYQVAQALLVRIDVHAADLER